jgi:hypothetical protein
MKAHNSTQEIEMKEHFAQNLTRSGNKKSTIRMGLQPVVFDRFLYLAVKQAV